MGLSEHEQRTLDELERSLKSDDAAFAAKLEKSSTLTPKRIISGVLVSVAGLSALVFGVIAHMMVAGAIGFVAMLGGLALATSKSHLAGTKKKSEGKGFFENRWDRRG